MKYETFTPEQLKKKAWEDKKEGDFARGRLRAAKKISKPCTWNGMQFNSARDLARHLKMGSHNNIYGAISNKREIKGHVPKYGTLEKDVGINEICSNFIKKFNRISDYYEYSDSYSVVQTGRKSDNELSSEFIALSHDDKKTVCQELDKYVANIDYVKVHLCAREMREFVTRELGV